MMTAYLAAAATAWAFVPASAPPRPLMGTHLVRHGQGRHQQHQHPPTMLNLDVFLEEEENARLATVLLALSDACKKVASKIATASCDSTSCFNELEGNPDEMLAIDLLAEEVLFGALKETGLVTMASSESDGVMRRLSLLDELPPPQADDADASHRGAASSSFSVSLDPLDASSIIDSNFAVGTIFAVWRGTSFLNTTGRSLIAAGTCTYGPRTALTLGLDSRDAVHEFLLVGDQWLQSNIYSGLGEGKLFAPGNLRATASRPGYARLVDYYQQAKYTLRYTGGLVPDVTQLIVKGRGIFTSVPEAGERPRLRLCYEAAPMAFLVEKAGGASSDGARSLLDIPISSPLDRTQVALGSRGEIERFEEMVGPSE